MCKCMPFLDNWEEKWRVKYADKKLKPLPEVSHHRHKFKHIDDRYNYRWEKCLDFGKWVTTDESHVDGCYKFSITVGPEPKPKRTGATMCDEGATPHLQITSPIFRRQARQGSVW